MLTKAGELGCNGADPKCLCSNQNFLYGVRDCSYQSCNDDGAAGKVVAFGLEYCKSELDRGKLFLFDHTNARDRRWCRHSHFCRCRCKCCLLFAYISYTDRNLVSGPRQDGSCRWCRYWHSLFGQWRLRWCWRCRCKSPGKNCCLDIDMTDHERIGLFKRCHYLGYRLYYHLRWLGCHYDGWLDYHLRRWCRWSGRCKRTFLVIIHRREQG